jgi:hypothetical protein
MSNIKSKKSNLGNNKGEYAGEDTGVPEFLQNRFHVERELKEYFAARGLKHRWINMTKFRSDRFHRTGYVPYKREADTPASVADQLLGTSPDGFIVRGDMVLAVKQQAQADKYRKWLRDKTDRARRNVREQAGAELRQQLRGLKAEIHEGYDDNK